MLKNLIIAMGLCVGFCTSAGKKLPVPDENSFFPLLPGSYWKFEDVIDNEVTQRWELHTVVSLQKTDTGYVAVVRVTSNMGVREFTLIYYCNEADLIYKKVLKEEGFDLLGKLHPTLSDTIVIDGEKRFYSRCCETCDSTCLMLQNFDMDGGQEGPPGKAWYGTWFVKGIGIVTTGTSESGYNLIEYRIGNGQVVKKRWAFE